MVSDEHRSRPAAESRWDASALRAGALLALVIAVPSWIGASWSMERESFALNALFTLVALIGFVLGAACSAWIQQRSYPLAHGVATAVGTYVAVQVIVSTYRVIMGTGVNMFSILLFTTVAAVAGLIGGVLGSRMRRLGFVPSSQRRLP